MPSYQCRVFDGDDHIYAVEQVECADASDAVERAEMLLARGRYHAVEVWDGACKIFRMTKPSTPTRLLSDHAPHDSRPLVRSGAASDRR
jgi:hypothetical protein